MARTKKVNEGMAHIRDAIQNRASARDAIKAKLADRLVAELERHDLHIYELMFKDFPEAGDSEIANSVGVSRNTVYLWRRDYKERFLSKGVTSTSMILDDGEDDVQVEVPDVVPSHEFGVEQWEGVKRLYVDYMGRRLYVTTHETMTLGKTAEEADENELKLKREGESTNEAPDWLTDDLLRDAERKFDLRIAFAPWR